MLAAVLAFLAYLGTSVALLWAFVWIYVRVTPYNDFELIAAGNKAAAVVLSGAILGFTLPLVAAIYYTHSLLEMLLWSGITCAVQLMVFIALRRLAVRIESDQLSSGLLVGTFSLALGLLTAVSISV